MDANLALLREFGFPVFVAVWFMWRLEKRVDRLFELMTALMQATSLLAKSVDDHRLGQRHNLHSLPAPPQPSQAAKEGGSP